MLFIAMSASLPSMGGQSSGFVFSIDTKLGEGVHTFTIPTNGTGYNYNVDCDDTNPQTNTAQAQITDYTCKYPSPGIYTIRIEDNVGDGTGFPQIYFNNDGDKDKILDVIQWGTGQWISMAGAFRGASNMTVTATDVPDLSQVTSMAHMFHNADLANPDTSGWNTANVKDMSVMFSNADSANPDTSGWNTANVINMQFMFFGADVAQPDTSSWNTLNVTNMSYMFHSAILANPDTSGWNTANVTTMRSMFSGAVLANPNTSNWNTFKVTNMQFMFSGAVSANPDTSSWDISHVEYMRFMFNGVTLPTANYDAMLVHFNSQVVQPGIEFDGGNSKYCSSSDHDNLINTHTWIITDAGLDSDLVCKEIDTIFRSSFEIPVEVFNVFDKQFIYDFGLLDTEILDSYPQLIAIGFDDDQAEVIKFHVRISGEGLQIRISNLNRNEFEEDQWTHQKWQVITNSQLTTVSW